MSQPQRVRLDDPTVYAYIRISTNRQTGDGQRSRLMDYASKNNIRIDYLYEVTMSSQAQEKKRMGELLDRLEAGDVLLTTELSRIGRKVVTIANFIDKMRKKQVEFISIKEGINTLDDDPRKRNESLIMVTMMSLMYEIERNLISERTADSLKAARKSGKKIGRPKGSTSQSKLEPHAKDIAAMLGHGFSKALIARQLRVSWSTLDAFIKSRSIKPDKKAPPIVNPVERKPEKPKFKITKINSQPKTIRRVK